jgi:hypothetical protein
VNGVLILPGINAYVERVRLINCWIGSADQNGMRVATGSGATVRHVQVLGCIVLLNAYHGLNFGSALEWQICDNLIFGNGTAAPSTYAGVVIQPGNSRGVISGNVIGTYDTALQTQHWGIVIPTGATDYLVVTNNYLYGATSSVEFVDDSAGQNKVIANNVGVDNRSTQIDANASANPSLGGYGFKRYTVVSGGLNPTVNTLAGGWLNREVWLQKTDAGTTTFASSTSTNGFYNTFLLTTANPAVALFDGTRWMLK